MLVGIAAVASIAASYGIYSAAVEKSGSESTLDIPPDPLSDTMPPTTASGDAVPVSAMDMPAIDSPVIPHHIANSNNAFAIDIYKELSAGSSNIFFSPMSIYVAFSALYEGARENTAKELETTFGFESNDDARHNYTRHMMASLNRDDPYATLAMANALWPSVWFDVYAEYLDVARSTYLAEVERLDFGRERADSVETINTWASDNTAEKIKKVLTTDDVNDLTAMVITNAIYFKGTWLTQFPMEDTEESDFWKNNETAVPADFMRVTSAFNYTESDGVQILKMPYEGDRLSMLVILPSARDGLASLEERLTSDMLWQYNDDLREHDEVIVRIPKFTIKEKYDLISPLKKLGINDVFDKHIANLSGMADITGNNLYVAKAVHDSFVDVNEEGTEAAAVTTIVVVTDSEQPLPPAFIADRPFLFVIQDDESGAILFMGRISDPTS